MTLANKLDKENVLKFTRMEFSFEKIQIRNKF
jgi:hypothetical protein